MQVSSSRFFRRVGREDSPVLEGILAQYVVFKEEVDQEQVNSHQLIKKLISEKGKKTNKQKNQP